LFLGIYYFVLPLVMQTPMTGISQHWPYWLYLADVSQTFDWKDIGPKQFWSLSVEEHFYLFWPVIIYYSGQKNIKRAIFCLIVMSIFTRFLLISHDYVFHRLTFARMDELAMGALLAVLKIGQPNPAHVKRFLGILAVTSVAIFILWIMFSGKYVMGAQVARYTLIALLYGCLIGIALSISNNTLIRRVLQNKFLRYTGKISYGLYVFHSLCFLVFHRYLHTDSVLLNFILSFALAYLIATASYYLFESVFLAAKRRFQYHTEGRQKASQAA
jgi:peptidoglycan/LPS O-acetylase OafA/YrhL